MNYWRHVPLFLGGAGTALAVAYLHTVYIIIILLGSGLLFLLFVLLRARNSLDLFEPAIVIFGVYIATFILPGILPFVRGTSDLEYRFYILAMGYAWLSLLIFVVSYHSAIGDYLAGLAPQLRGGWNHRRLPLVVTTFSVIGFSGYYAGMELVGGITHYVTNIGDRISMVEGLGYVFQLRNFAVTANLLWYISITTRRGMGSNIRKAEILIYGLHLLSILAMLLTLGSRGTVLSIFVLMMIARSYLLRRVRLRWLFAFCIGVGVFAYAYGVFRSFSDEAGFYERAIEKETIAQFVSAGLADGGRMVAGIAERVGRDIDFQWGRTYWNVVYFPIPRYMFESKPKTGGELITEEIFYKSATLGRDNLAPTMVGEAYLNFGVTGIVVVSVLFGILAKTGYSYMRMNWGNPSVVAIVVPLFISGYLFPAGEFINSVSDLIKVGINWLGVLAMVKKVGK